jgi:rare lipoprotein A
MTAMPAIIERVLYYFTMKKLFFCLLLLIISFPGAYAQRKVHHYKHAATETGDKKSIVKYGTASFYAKKFNGRQTASGEIYNSTKYTAACNVLPLHTWIKVTNLSNKKTVIVKTNDRLYAKNKRLVDLSRIAAQELGYTGRGLARVKVEVLPDYEFSTR